MVKTNKGKSKKRVTILTGAGISAESGIKTFRDSDGLWENYSVEDVATPRGWLKNKQLVLDFYNARRKDVKAAQPNLAHKKLVKLEKYFAVNIVTQNIDDLHERAGSKKVLHLHGEILKSQSNKYPELTYDCPGDINVGDLCEKGSQLRPNVVWFEESVPLLMTAEVLVWDADYFIIIGTSLQVYPAAALIMRVNPKAKIIILDPNIPDLPVRFNKNEITYHESEQYTSKPLKKLTCIEKKATEGVEDLEKLLLDDIKFEQIKESSSKQKADLE